MNKPIDPKLAKFIADSKVKERVYHGTQGDFNQFKSGPRNRIVKGIYFAQNPQTASIFAGQGEGANVMPVHLRMQNPASELDMERILDALPYEAKRTAAQRTAQLKKAGHDSVIMNNGAEGQSGNNYYIAFEPNQIKSAIGNRGTYDPNDPDITKADGGNVPSSPTPSAMPEALQKLREQMRQQVAASTPPLDQKTKEWQQSAAFNRIFPRAHGGRVTHAHHLQIEERPL
jgi:hypothetical protein